MTVAKIFICYRRDDSAYPAHQIYRDLSNHFGSESVVLDVDNILLGTDFREYLNKQVSKCDILLAVIGDQWIEILKQRLDEPNDYVRVEIQAALESDIPVVPVLVGKASVPDEKNLPPELVKLAYKQAAEVRAGPDLQTHLTRLVDGLVRLIAERKAEEESKQKEAEEEEEERKRKAEENRKQREADKAKRKAEEKRNRKKTEEEADRTRIAEAERKAEKKRKQKKEQKLRATPKTYTNAIGMEFNLIDSGFFTMGSSSGDEDEEPPHEVQISKSFYLQTTQVTQGQWKEVMGDNPSEFNDCGEDCPVEQVSWDDGQEFIQKLNEMEGTDKFRYRLPTEAEWEYACRGGTTTEYSCGEDTSKLIEYAWYGDNSEEKIHPVGQKMPNAWGLYDMHGNVWEWMEDDWHDSYGGALDDGCAWVDDPRGDVRVMRGGSWGSFARNCRSANRDYGWPDDRYSDVGFRLARSVTLDP
jgi:formylglycine-generating enzyme required for sulfatase activity